VIKTGSGFVEVLDAVDNEPGVVTKFIEWKDEANVDIVTSAATGRIEKNAGGAGFDAGAISTKAINSLDGHIKCNSEGSTGGTSHSVLGLGNSDSGYGRDDAEFNINTTVGASNNYKVREGGVNKFLASNFNEGDEIEIAIEDGVIKYKLNSTVRYTSLLTPVLPLFADVTFQPVGRFLDNCEISGELTDTP